MMETKLEADWIQVTRTVPDDVGQSVIKMAVDASTNNETAPFVSVTGNDSSYESRIAESQVSTYVEMVSELEDGEDSQQKTLPEDFFERLSTRQEIFLEILAKSDQPVTGPDIRNKMRSEYDQEVSDSGSGTAGIISGFTRKYGTDFRDGLIIGRVSHHNDEDNRVFEHELGDTYKEEIEEYFDTDGDSDTDDDSDS